MTSNCNLIFKSVYNENPNTSIVGQLFSLNKKEYYFHMNERVLNSFSTDDRNIAETRFENEQIFANKNVLFVGHGSASRMPILKHIAQYKFNKLVGLCKAQTWAKTCFSEWICADPDNIEFIHETIDSVLDYMNDNNMKFDAIVTYDDYCIEVATFLANYFDLPSTPFNTLLAIRNKDSFRKLCYELDINHPRSLSIRSDLRGYFLDRIISKDITDLKSFKNEPIRFPVIIKNTKGAGKGMYEILLQNKSK
jgi:hypothetical protein